MIILRVDNITKEQQFLTKKQVKKYLDLEYKYSEIALDAIEDGHVFSSIEAIYRLKLLPALDFTKKYDILKLKANKGGIK